LVGVDYSRSSIAAIDRALEICRGLPATRVVVLLALPGGPTTSPPAAARSSEELIERSGENLRGLVAARVATLEGMSAPTNVEAVVAFGSPGEALVEAARERNAYLVVVGPRGRRGVQRLLLGSVAEEVVREAPCSVLVVRSPEPVEPKQPSAASGEGFDEEPGGDAAASDSHVIGLPHLESGRVVVVVLDEPSQRTFTCSFEGFGSVTVEALEGEWVAPSNSAERARAARAALRLSRTDRSTFEQLFDELARRNARDN
jgi:nucleotide-binding universal stress UspA family protein